MKQRSSLAWGLGLVIGFIPVSSALTQEVPEPAPRLTPPGPSPKPATVQDNAIHPKIDQSPPGAYVSAWLLDVIKLSQARIDETVMLTFVDSAGTFNLDADQIIFLRDLGISTDLITAMIQHDFEILSGQRQIPAAPSGSQPMIHLAPSTNASEQQTVPARSPSHRSTSVVASPVTLAQALSPQILEKNQPVNSAEPVFINNEDYAPDGAELQMPRQSSLPREMKSPVRKPYPVQLLDPIVMIRGEGRTANLLVIELRP